MTNDIERDYCDLDPTKICDNCCKCIENGREYNDVQIELTDQISTLDEIMQLPFDDGMGGGAFDDDESVDPSHVAPLDIDPKLVAEWEKKLRIAEIEEAQSAVNSLHGKRKLDKIK